MKLLLLVLSLAAATALPGQAIIAKWTFEVSQPVTGGPISPEIGTGTATTLHGAHFSSPVGNGSDHSWMSARPPGGPITDGFNFAVSTLGRSSIAVSFDLAYTGNWSPTQERFTLAVSFDNSNFTTTGFPFIQENTWVDSSVQSGFTFHYGPGFFFSDSMLADKPIVYFKVTTGIPEGGALQIDNFTVSAIPEPSTYAALAGIGALGLAIWRRPAPRKSA